MKMEPERLGLMREDLKRWSPRNKIPPGALEFLSLFRGRRGFLLNSLREERIIQNHLPSHANGEGVFCPHKLNTRQPFHFSVNPCFQSNNYNPQKKRGFQKKILTQRYGAGR
jgi:hypothetical protein